MLMWISTAFSWLTKNPTIAMLLVGMVVAFGTGWHSARRWYAGDAADLKTCERNIVLEKEHAVYRAQSDAQKAMIATLEKRNEASQKLLAEEQQARAVWQSKMDKLKQDQALQQRKIHALLEAQNVKPWTDSAVPEPVVSGLRELSGTP